jgi:hypothetical protein
MSFSRKDFFIFSMLCIFMQAPCFGILDNITNDDSPRNTLATSQRPLEGNGEPVLAPMPAKLISINVEKNQEVNRGDLLCTIEAMKMQICIRAPIKGMVGHFHFTEGDIVSDGDLLFKLLPQKSARQVLNPLTENETPSPSLFQRTSPSFTSHSSGLGTNLSAGERTSQLLDVNKHLEQVKGDSPFSEATPSLIPAFEQPDLPLEITSPVSPLAVKILSDTLPAVKPSMKETSQASFISEQKDQSIMEAHKDSVSSESEEGTLDTSSFLEVEEEIISIEEGATPYSTTEQHNLRTTIEEHPPTPSLTVEAVSDASLIIGTEGEILSETGTCLPNLVVFAESQNGYSSFQVSLFEKNGSSQRPPLMSMKKPLKIVQTLIKKKRIEPLF